MLPNLDSALAWLKQHPQAVRHFKRGLERETLRFLPNNHLALTPHPPHLGSALCNPWITTDFSESLLEFVTPVRENAADLTDFLWDLHRFSLEKMGKERFWPMSMPCFIDDESDIVLAQYGASNLGRYKTLYREGLKNRYGALMQTIAGIHYNFSFDEPYWQARFPDLSENQQKAQLSARYFNLIRNYLRYGWVIPYLFGASPAICSCFLQGRNNKIEFERSPHGFLYLPYATSLRLSDLGYTTDTQSNLGINYNELQQYTSSLRAATRRPEALFAHIDQRNGQDGKAYHQLNANVLQSEAEFYAQIRPKRVVKDGERAVAALERAGIQYVEVRSLDVNPYSAVGISEQQIYFLDLFMLWCELAEAPRLGDSEQQCCRKNWNKVILAGRKPQQTIGVGCDENEYSLQAVGEAIFDDLLQLAAVVDCVQQSPEQAQEQRYGEICRELRQAFADPDLTLSARVLADCHRDGIGAFGYKQAESFKQAFLSQPYRTLNQQQLRQVAQDSVLRQQAIEQADTLSFDQYLALQNSL
ncbi:glutamate-cysteine ligase [Pasteurella testudinis DSM 23072]|uniref:Glutamate--cysteine ligase n=1 Tax=Pasteurella testudinis DSM 23072 TaxID=1122938 RepID=A0A1W1UGE9_9PAST|nr:glutamate--cysteine ligase [Pasteurella testudinis]SMB80113.1 glutamate-cysteine ligase [Pasteurella testudinis DSM 23072]SUB50596.1 glutathione biosynthesis bifunctional protein GshAB [Pasteurella testudinis]